MMYVVTVKTCPFAGRPVARGGGGTMPARQCGVATTQFLSSGRICRPLSLKPPLPSPLAGPSSSPSYASERQKRCLGLSLASLQADTAHDRLCKHRRNAHMLLETDSE